MIERAPRRVCHDLASENNAIHARVNELLAAMIVIALQRASGDWSVDVAT
jgi:hypothetical protein